MTVCAVAIVTFSAADERLHAWLTDRDQIDAARAAQAGGTQRGLRLGASYPEPTSTPVGSGTWMMSLLLKAQSDCAPAVGPTSNSKGPASGVAVTARRLPGSSISPRGRLGVNWNEFSARRYRGRTFQNAVTPTALNVARSLDLCCVQ